METLFLSSNGSFIYETEYGGYISIVHDDLIQEISSLMCIPISQIQPTIPMDFQVAEGDVRELN